VLELEDHRASEKGLKGGKDGEENRIRFRNAVFKKLPNAMPKV
jgi:hypothetical protein